MSDNAADAAEEYPKAPWRTPANLLDNIETILWKLNSACCETVSPDGEFGFIGAGFVCGKMEVLGCIVLPELREVLRETGVDVPGDGAWRELADEWHASREEQEPPPGEVKVEEIPEVQVAVPEVPPPSAPTTRFAAGGEPQETKLYRWYDEDDLLLYVGISDKLGSRTRGHAMGSSWMDFAVRSTIERYPSRPAALAIEEAAIKAEKPLFNFQHNQSPDAQRHLVHYLIKHGRTDLLTPSVSRG